MVTKMATRIVDCTNIAVVIYKLGMKRRGKEEENPPA
jgi:hypothetical protein